MKTFYFVMTGMLLSVSIFTQQPMKNTDIEEKIQKGESIIVENAVITGTLQLTNYTGEGDKSFKKWIDKAWKSKSNMDENTITSSIIFRNVIFEDDVIAYIHDDEFKWTFVANFENEVVFQNCIFKGSAEFKYSKFESGVDFSGSQFRKGANFKYAKFMHAANFASTSYAQEGQFKYAKFSDFAQFNSSLFNQEANFKYSKFENGLNFHLTSFNGLLNMKYAKIYGKIDLEANNIEDLDVKYAKIEGRDATSYLLKEYLKK